MLIRSLRLSILWALLILILSIAPHEEFENKSMDNLDKVVHFFFYGVLSHLIMLSFLKQRQYKQLHQYGVYVAFGITFLYGLGIEILQGTVFVSRSIEAMDMLANTIGSLLGLVSFYLIYRTFKK
ncbi:MAG: hypothetical protein CL843_11295 [Crocinitomicaceae bacterium]|nr:hypothetical protein [Crocinitomicaceae bacterium]|tara:strand:- start:256 stop:630 length:375 start_codon:yes stop_codon:yes gene_type:complete